MNSQTLKTCAKRFYKFRSIEQMKRKLKVLAVFNLPVSPFFFNPDFSKPVFPYEFGN